MRQLVFMVCFNLAFTSSFCQQKKICITIDDILCANCADRNTTLQVNEKMLAVLQQFDVPAIGFVNENKLYTGNKPDSTLINALEKWYVHGFELGNHTFSHIYIDRSTLTEYTADLLKGEIISKQLAKKHNRPYRFFRHTQLRTGPTPAYKKQLDSVLVKYGYTIAPVTIDNDEYIYAACYKNACLEKDTTSMRLIAYEYLAYMRSIFTFYENLSEKVLGYNVAHTLLIHANQLNADYLPYLLLLIKDRGYNFVSLTEALTDSAYGLPDAQSTKGLSWINRWEISKGLTYTPQPDVPTKIMALFTGDVKQQTPFQHFVGNENEINAILTATKRFSFCFVNGLYDEMMNAYTQDGKIFANGSEIKQGYAAILKAWKLPEDQKTLHHSITPLEIEISGNTAYDHGYYEGSTQLANGTITWWRGKYVVIWKKDNGKWRMYLDIWNRI